DERGDRQAPLSLDELTAQYRLLIGPGNVAELRALQVRDRGDWTFNVSGFFDEAAVADGRMAKEALRLSDQEQAKGVYFTLNPLDPDILARRLNRTARAKDDECAKDHHVRQRRWLLVDPDPKRRVTGISSTAAEKERCRDTTLAVRGHLTG